MNYIARYNATLDSMAGFGYGKDIAETAEVPQ